MRSTKTRRDLLRYQMTDRAAIVARMAEDVSDLARRRGLDRDVTEDDLIRLGWEPGQIRVNRAEVMARVYRNRSVQVAA